MAEETIKSADAPFRERLKWCIDKQLEILEQQVGIMSTDIRPKSGDLMGSTKCSVNLARLLEIMESDDGEVDVFVDGE